MYSAFDTMLDSLSDNLLSMLVDIVINLSPVIFTYLAFTIVISFIKHLLTPKYDGPVFDDNYAKDFDLMYDAFADEYESEEDFINDYMSDFTAFHDEPELDELVELDIWDTLSYDYDDPETLYIKQYDVDFDISYDDYDGSFTDYVENSELE